MEHNQAISRENFSEVVRLWWCVLITQCAHSFSPNSLSYFSCLCLSSSLLSVCLPFICCHSVFIWTPITLALLSLSLCLSHSLPHMVILVLAKPVCYELACSLACHWRVRWRSPSHISYLQRANRDSHPDVRGRRTETKRLRESFRRMHWINSLALHAESSLKE